MAIGASLHGSGSGPNASLGNLANMFSNKGGSFMDSLSGIGDFLGGKSGQGLMGLGSLALGGYGLNKSLGFQEDQLDMLKEQENRAATAQNFQTGNSLAMQAQTTTPGTPEHARAMEAIANGTFEV